MARDSSRVEVCFEVSRIDKTNETISIIVRSWFWISFSQVTFESQRCFFLTRRTSDIPPNHYCVTELCILFVPLFEGFLIEVLHCTIIISVYQMAAVFFVGGMWKFTSVSLSSGNLLLLFTFLINFLLITFELSGDH